VISERRENRTFSRAQRFQRFGQKIQSAFVRSVRKITGDDNDVWLFCNQQVDGSNRSISLDGAVDVKVRDQPNLRLPCCPARKLDSDPVNRHFAAVFGRKAEGKPRNSGGPEL
jgi:hypothetical protein